MRTALYYPHTEVQSETLIRTALLTWDQLEYIVPWKGYQSVYENRYMAEAMEMIGRPRSPLDAERLQVHSLVKDLIKKGVPETFHYDARGTNSDYELWPQKLMIETWDLLRGHNLVGPLLANADYPASQAVGLTIMSMLADVMAGETRARITDRGMAYATIANTPGSRDPRNIPESQIAHVVPLTFKTLALEHVGLDKLIAFRKREAKAMSGHHYRALRHQYLDNLEAHVSNAVNYPLGSRDREEVDRIFEEKMEDDLKDLKDELGVARRDAVLSKDTIAFVLAGAALTVAGLTAAATLTPIVIPAALTMTGAPATIGGVLGITNKYAAKRKEIMRKHPMAYLYEIER